ncbi:MULTISPECIES: hypothetical protein [Moorena]|nr:hypothetical protein [Moorena sp. SIO4G3]
MGRWGDGGRAVSFSEINCQVNRVKGSWGAGERVFFSLKIPFY